MYVIGDIRVLAKIAATFNCSSIVMKFVQTYGFLSDQASIHWYFENNNLSNTEEHDLSNANLKGLKGKIFVNINLLQDIS
jgi:hypothetical protein